MSWMYATHRRKEDAILYFIVCGDYVDEERHVQRGYDLQFRCGMTN